MTYDLMPVDPGEIRVLAVDPALYTDTNLGITVTTVACILSNGTEI